MKRHWVILFVVPLFAQDTDIRSIKALKYHNDITEISQSTLDVLSSEGLDILYNQWINVADWNNDNLNDLVLQIASEPTINAYVTLFKRSDQGDKIRFVEDPNYLMSIQGDVNDFRYTAGDFNGDNLIDSEDSDEIGSPRESALSISVRRLTADIVNEITNTW